MVLPAKIKQSGYFGVKNIKDYTEWYIFLALDVLDQCFLKCGTWTTCSDVN